MLSGVISFYQFHENYYHSNGLKNSHETWNSQSSCFILVLQSYPTLKFVYDIASWSLWIPTSVTRLGDLLDFGQLFKAFGNNYFAQILHIIRQFL